MSESRNLSSKKELAASFGKAAADYDRAARLQKLVGNQLIELGVRTNDYSDREDGLQKVVDLGCGTGYFLEKLNQQFNPKTILAVDLSLDMLEFARSKSSGSPFEAKLEFIESDAESLSLSGLSADFVYSSLALQWVVDLSRATDEVMRVLKPGGMFVFSTLLDGTLSELKQAWSSVDDGQHVNDFLSLDDCVAALKKSGFEIVHANSKDIEIEYDQALMLMRDLKAIGAHNISQGRNRTITAPGKLKGAIKAYEAFRKSNGKLPANYKTGFFAVRKPSGDKF